MRLNNDCVRDLLLYIEKHASLIDEIDIEEINDLDYPTEELLYTSIKLKEAGYINAIISETFDGYSVLVRSLTWNGHKFLDNIRDNVVWKSTKAIISKFSSVSLSLIEKIAAQVITNLINQYMGQSN